MDQPSLLDLHVLEQLGRVAFETAQDLLQKVEVLVFVAVAAKLHAGSVAGAAEGAEMDLL